MADVPKSSWEELVFVPLTAVTEDVSILSVAGWYIPETNRAKMAEIPEIL